MVDFKTIKKVRADNKFELMFLVRKYKRQGWQQGNIERYPSEFKTWVCYMTRSDDMREIKFRAWDGKLMHNVAELVFDMGPKLDGKGIRFYGPGVGQGRIDGEKIILTQYTGLKDKNGTEIYEGDIIRSKHMQVGKVYWCEEKSTYLIYWFEEEYNTFLQVAKDGEIIGNIYEDEHLLD